jgi:hypothetical protein
MRSLSPGADVDGWVIEIRSAFCLDGTATPYVCYRSTALNCERLRKAVLID